MGRLREVNGLVRMTLDKLLGIRSDLVRLDDNWQNWDFPHLVEAIMKWTERNPGNTSHEFKAFYRSEGKRDKLLNTQNARKRMCIYCDNYDHKSG